LTSGVVRRGRRDGRLREGWGVRVFGKCFARRVDGKGGGVFLVFDEDLMKHEIASGCFNVFTRYWLFK